ncbi:MAG TPA: PhoH family protein [Phycisphaerae bacterium]|nr:PhoH family protein [Phycisphaerae bacterium]
MAKDIPAVSQNAEKKSSPDPDTKYFVLDTNVLLHNPNSLFAFADNHVIIPFDVLEELDKFKKDSTDVGRSARTAIRHIDTLREKGTLLDGVKWNGHGGTIRVSMDHAKTPIDGLDFNKPDNRIISVAYRLKEEGKHAVFISKDINARIKSDALGIITEDFENQKVDYETLYSGYREIAVPPSVIDRLYADKRIAVTDPLLAGLAPRLHPNEYVLFKASGEESHTGLARYVPAMNAVLPLSRMKKAIFGITPRNLQQIMALDLLLDDDVQMVTLMGTAGTGKTLLALAAGMHKCFQEQGGGGAGRYERLLVARPIMPMGRDIGFLPGTKDEKLSAWMKPIFDNLEFLLTDRRVHSGETANVEARLKGYVDSGKLVLEALTYIRGRSIPHQFMIVDEAQNLTPHEIKTIASRVGEGTKLVLTGDAEQIDNPYLDANSNGLSFTIEKLKSFDLVGHVTLARPERSSLASLVVKEL